MHQSPVETLSEKQKKTRDLDLRKESLKNLLRPKVALNVFLFVRLGFFLTLKNNLRIPKTTFKPPV